MSEAGEKEARVMDLTTLFDRVVLSTLLLDFLGRHEGDPREMVETLIRAWRTRCRQRINEEIKEAETGHSDEARVKRIMSKLAGYGDAEDLRTGALKRLEEAEGLIRGWTDSVLESVEK